MESSVGEIKGSKSDYAVKPAQNGDIVLEQGCFGSRWPGYNSPLGAAGVAPKSLNSLKPDAYFLITWFSKAHYVSPSLYEKDADLYTMYHWREALLLAQEIESYETIYREWADPSGFMDSMVAGTVYTTRAVTDWTKSWFTEIKKAPKPDLAEFRKLVDRTYDVLDLVAKSDLQVDKTVKNGLELARIRQDLRTLDRKVQDFRNRAIDSAEQITAGLETVESTSFQVLNVVPTLLMMDPLREAAYKITVLLVRTSARGAGGALAYGTKDAFLNEALGVLKREVPGLIVDLLLLPLNRLTKALGWSNVARDAVAIVVQQILEFVAGLVKTIIANKGKSMTRDQWESLLVERLSSLVGVLVSRLFHVKMTDKNTQVLVKSTAEALAKVLTSEIYVIYKICDEQGRDVSEVVLAELPTIIMRVAEAVVVGFAQRKASQTQEYMQTQRVTEQTDFTEAATIAKKTTVSQIWNSKVSREGLMDVRSGRARAIPFTDWEYREVFHETVVGGQKVNKTWRETNLEYETASGVRRFADECQMLCFYHAPNKSRLNHTQNPEDKGAKWGKPGTLQTKSADGPDMPAELAGLVVKPGNGPPATHKDVAGAKGNWDKHLAEAIRNGMMVRPDGLVFHPDQLDSWANIRPFDVPAIAKAKPLFNKLQQEGIYDLSNDPEPSQKAKLDKAIADGKFSREDVDAARSLVQDAKIGFYSDLDPIDFVDAKTGESKHFGNKPKEALDIAAENRRLINEYVSKDLKGKNIENDPRQSGAPGVGGEPDKRTEHPESEVQHGASAHMEGRGMAVKDQKVKVKDGAFAAGPGGELVFFFNKVPPEKLAGMSAEERESAVHEDIMKQWDDYVKSKVGDQKFKEQKRRVDEIKKEPNDVRYHKVKKVPQKKPPGITIPDIEESSRAIDGVEVLEEKGLGFEVSELAVLNSLHVRGLHIGESSVLRAAVPTYKLKSGTATSPSELEAAKQKYKTFIGIDEHECNMVIAVRHYGQTIAEAILSLVKTRRALGSLWQSNNYGDLRIWYEIYTAYRPITAGYVRDRIGGPKTGLPGPFDEFAEQAPTFDKPGATRVYAFSIKGVVETYSPHIKDAGKFQGLYLHDVIEDTKKLTLRDRPTAILEGGVKTPIAMFTSPIEDDTHLCVPYIDPKAEAKAEAVEKAKAKSREASMAGAR
jgi:hypothetical protein